MKPESSGPLNALSAPDAKSDTGPGQIGISDDPPSAKRRRWLVGSTAAVAVAAGVGWARWRDYTAETTADPALAVFWQTQFETPAGSKLATVGFKGRPLLINFWATWCPPCVDELPLIEAFYRKNSSNGWQVLGIAADKTSSVTAFLAKLPLSFPVAIAGLDGIALSRALGNLAGGLPFTVVLGRDGQVIQRKIGQIQPQDLHHWASLH